MFTSNGGNGIGLPYMYDHHQQTCFLHLPPDSLPEMIKESSPCKKPIKKDRHSKIVTAQGARDRRMRLSLEIAKRFFHLQDLLGFDKASKTIGWLLNQARVAINELVASPGSGRIKDLGCSGKTGSTYKAGTSPASDGEIGSGIDESTMEENQNDNWMEKIPAGFKEGKIRKKVANPLARESRAKARLRARQRTWMKKSLDDTKNLRSASPLETGEEVISFQSMDHQGSYPNIGEDCFSSIYCLDCNENIGLNQKGTINFFMENGMGRTHSSGFVNPQNHVSIEAGQDNNLIAFPFSPALSVPFADIPLWSKSWEGFSNQSLC